MWFYSFKCLTVYQFHKICISNFSDQPTDPVFCKYFFVFWVRFKKVPCRDTLILITLSNVYFLAFEYIPDSEITGLTGSEEDLLDRVSVTVVLENLNQGFFENHFRPSQSTNKLRKLLKNYRRKSSQKKASKRSWRLRSLENRNRRSNGCATTSRYSPPRNIRSKISKMAPQCWSLTTSIPMIWVQLVSRHTIHSVWQWLRRSLRSKVLIWFIRHMMQSLIWINCYLALLVKFFFRCLELHYLCFPNSLESSLS